MDENLAGTVTGPEGAQAEDGAAEREQLIQAVIAGTKSGFPVEFEVADKKFSLNWRWPDMDDEAMIESIAARIHYPALTRELPARAQEAALARATIEVLAQAPFPDWLPSHDEPATVKGVKSFRPNTGKVRHPALVVAAYRALEVERERFQHLVLG